MEAWLRSVLFLYVLEIPSNCLRPELGNPEKDNRGTELLERYFPVEVQELNQ